MVCRVSLRLVAAPVRVAIRVTRLTAVTPEILLLARAQTVAVVLVLEVPDVALKAAEVVAATTVAGPVFTPAVGEVPLIPLLRHLPSKTVKTQEMVTRCSLPSTTPPRNLRLTRRLRRLVSRPPPRQVSQAALLAVNHPSSLLQNRLRSRPHSPPLDPLHSHHDSLLTNLVLNLRLSRLVCPQHSHRGNLRDNPLQNHPDSPQANPVDPHPTSP